MKVAQSCLTLCNPVDDTVHGIRQARILQCGVAFSFSRGSSWPVNQTGVSCFANRFFTNWAIREASLSDENFTLFWFVCFPQEPSQISLCETVPRGHFTLLTSPYFSCGCFLSFSFKLTQPSPPELRVRLKCYCTALWMPMCGWDAPFTVEHELNTLGHIFFSSES